jgi:hypothetical protein
VGLDYVWDNSGFSNGGVPLFAIIGFNNVVYWDNNDRNFTEALNQAIDEFPREGLYVKNPIADRMFSGEFLENIDISNVFDEFDGNPFTVEILENTDPFLASAVLSANELTISGTSGKFGETKIRLKAVSGEYSAEDEFIISLMDPEGFVYLENGFESESFPPPFWEIKYNTAADGGLTGNNLRDPISGEKKWSRNSKNNTTYGAGYIHSGDYSAIIEYWAPEFNWLIMPEMRLDFDDYELKFWVWYSTSEYETKFYVLVNDGTIGWRSILDWNASDSDNLYTSEVSLSLSQYFGKKIRIAYVYEFSDGYEVALDDIRVVSPSGIENSEKQVSGLELHQNYPNPFNPSTKISFSIGEASAVKLSVFNHKGELVRNIFDGRLDNGNHSYDLDGSDLTSGIYFYKLETKNESSMKKMIMLK